MPADRRATEHRFTWEGDVIRVVICGDVVALPGEGWAGEGYGAYISEEWLLTQPRPRLPGPKARRAVLASCIRRALAAHHGGPTTEAPELARLAAIGKAAVEAIATDGCGVAALAHATPGEVAEHLATLREAAETLSALRQRGPHALALTEAEWSAGRWLLRRGDRTIEVRGWSTDAWAIMLELDEAQRIALDLPECEAVTGGTALCLGRADKVADGTVPLPSAPTCWDELASAELWPLGWLGAHLGYRCTVALPEEQ